jgi:hypothetical protein
MWIKTFSETGKTVREREREREKRKERKGREDNLEMNIH